MNQHNNPINLVTKAIKDPNRALKLLSYKLLGTIGQTDFKRFIVLSRSRTGSNMLMSYLDSHPNIHAEREIFARLNGRSCEEVLAKAYGKQPHYIKATGFKIFYYHPLDDDSQDIWERLKKSNNISVIHLKRRNILRTLISRKIAANQDTWELKNASISDNNKSKDVDFTIEELEKGFRRTRDWEKFGDKIFEKHPLISVYYEDIANNREETLSRVTEFLGVDHIPLKTNLKKQNPERLQDLVTNYDELKSAFSGTEWQAFFEE